MSQSYFAATEEKIDINRSPVTTISNVVPSAVSTLTWEFNLNALLQSTGIVAPRQIDAGEQIHKRGASPNEAKYVYLVGTDNNRAEIEVEKSILNELVCLNYTKTIAGVVTELKVSEDTEALAMVELAKRLKVETSLEISIISGLQDVHSTISIVRYSAPASSVGDSLTSGTQIIAVAKFLNKLKTKTSGDSWYFANAKNDKGIGVRVKESLALLFDKDIELNNLLGSAANSGVFLDLAKIEGKMENEPGNDEFYSKMFSVQQLCEVLEAVYDKGDKIAHNATTDTYTYNFAPGDTITCVIRVTDSDTKVSANGPNGNSDRWLLTLKQQ